MILSYNVRVSMLLQMFAQVQLSVCACLVYCMLRPFTTFKAGASVQASSAEFDLTFLAIF